MACLSLTGLLAMLEVLPGLAAKEFGSATQPGLDKPRVFMRPGCFFREALLEPVDSNGKPQTFRIQDGDTVNLIALHLEDAGLIRDAGAFRLYLIYSGADTRLGSRAIFSLSSPVITVLQIASILQDANAKDVNFRILAGWRLEEVAAALAVSGMAIKPEEFMLEVTQPVAANLPSSLAKRKNLANPGVRSLAFTAVQNRTTRAARWCKVLQQFDENVNADLRQAFQSQGLDLVPGSDAGLHRPA